MPELLPAAHLRAPGPSQNCRCHAESERDHPVPPHPDADAARASARGGLGAGIRALVVARLRTARRGREAVATVDASVCEAADFEAGARAERDQSAKPAFLGIASLADQPS